jgi:hypothetical protein
MSLKGLGIEPVWPETKNDCDAKGEQQIIRLEPNHFTSKDGRNMFHWES